uniref:Uncharacterized protein n=1 Tax=Physcomitrium patens TaxID=3218 RepID=A0A2K1IFY7_PHYPA|nr:hypothetical protein PHYPA_028783 [Physcomitrium patens]
MCRVQRASIGGDGDNRSRTDYDRAQKITLVSGADAYSWLDALGREFRCL